MSSVWTLVGAAVVTPVGMAMVSLTGWPWWERGGLFWTQELIPGTGWPECGSPELHAPLILGALP